jgi:hypothetical protein
MSIHEAREKEETSPLVRERDVGTDWDRWVYRRVLSAARREEVEYSACVATSRRTLREVDVSSCCIFVDAASTMRHGLNIPVGVCGQTVNAKAELGDLVFICENLAEVYLGDGGHSVSNKMMQMPVHMCAPPPYTATTSGPTTMRLHHTASPQPSHITTALTHHHSLHTSPQSSHITTALTR